MSDTYPSRSPAKQREYHKRWLDTRGIAIRKAYANRTKPAQADRLLNWHLKKNYGITITEYRRLEVVQGGVCAICSLPQCGASPTLRRLHVDHDHKTGKVRGLLCNRCNSAIGLLKDNPDAALSAAVYLENHLAD